MIKINRAALIEAAEREQWERRCKKAQTSLLEFVRLTYPKFKINWHHKVVCYYLEKFWRGEINLILCLPPRNGKTELAGRNLAAWGLGNNPDFEIISSTYSADLSSRTNRDVQRIIESDVYRDIFPDVRLQGTKLPDDGTGRSVALKNSSTFEIVKHKGVYRSAGVGGGITGMGFERGLIDDPIKDAAEAKSRTVRESVWEWFGSVFYTRKSPTAKICITMTRWHEDDLVGKLIESMKEKNSDQYVILKLPAICEDENEVDADVLKELGLEPRKIGDPLDANRFPLEELSKIRLTMGERAFTSIQQQKPAPTEGELFKWQNLRIINAVPTNIVKWIRYWDKAGTEGGTGAQTAGALLGITTDNWVVIVDIVSGRWAAPERERVIKQTAIADGTKVKIWVEQEPGSGGKESGENTVVNLQGFTCKLEKVTGDKVTRAEPLSCQMDVMNVYAVEGAYLRGEEGLLEQLKIFPNGKLKDKIDACGGAYNKLTGEKEGGFWI